MPEQHETKSEKIRFGLGARMVIAFLVVVVVAMTIPAIYFMNFLPSRIYHEARLKMESDLEIATLLFNGKKRSIERIAISLSRDIYFTKMVQTRVGESIRVRVRYFLQAYSESDFTYLTVTDSNGIVLFRSNAIYSTGDTKLDTPTVRVALKGESTISFERMAPEDMWRNGLLEEPALGSKADTGLVIEATLPIFLIDRMFDMEGLQPQRSDRGKIVGTITVGYLLNKDKDLLSEIHKRTRGISAVYLTGGLVNASDPMWTASLPDDVFKAAFKWGSHNEIRDYTSKEEIAGYFSLLDSRSLPAGIFELRTSTASIRQYKQRALTICMMLILLGVGLAGILGVLLTRRITEPIMRLRQGAEEIGAGNLQFRIDVPGDDEISRLADSFNNMTMRLFQSMEDMRLSKQQVEEYSQRLKSAHSSQEMYSKELEKVNQQLLDGNVSLRKANEVKDTFISTVSHELRTPLTSIIGYTTMMLEGVLGPLTGDMRNSLEVILRRGGNLQDLITDLLDLSRIDAGRVELRRSYIDPGKEVRALEEVFRERLKESNLTLDIEIAEDIEHLYADPDRLNQVLFNLVGNAIKFTSPGGRIDVRASNLKEDEKDYVEFTVSDTGIGIAGDEISHIFDRFYQVDKHDHREFAGTGLGLSIAKELVELHGGTIWAESLKGHGSTFYFILPLK